jgi:ABC-type transport system substrate-binding protein
VGQGRADGTRGVRPVRRRPPEAGPRDLLDRLGRQRGDADFVETVGFDDLPEVARNPDVRLVPIRGYEYGFAAFNLRTPDGKAPHPILGDRALRRALTMAADRAAMVRTIHDSLGRPGIGPFSRSQWTADTTLATLRYDPVAARRTLDSLGWRVGADGIRTRNGQRLAVAITVLATNRVRPRYAELLQQAWREIGVAASVEPVDPSGLTDRLGKHRFDAAIFSWRATPSPSGARQTWGSAGYRPGSPFNAGGYQSAAFDAHVDSGLGVADVVAARAHFRAAYQTAIDDAPAVWLYEPMVTALAGRRLVTGEIRPDAWWQSIRHWDVTGPRRPGAAADTTGTRAPTP